MSQVKNLLRNNENILYFYFVIIPCEYCINIIFSSLCSLLFLLCHPTLSQWNVTVTDKHYNDFIYIFGETSVGSMFSAVFIEAKMKV